MYMCMIQNDGVMISTQPRSTMSHASRRRSSTVCSTSWMTWPLDERKPITVSVNKNMADG